MGAPVGLRCVRLPVLVLRIRSLPAAATFMLSLRELKERKSSALSTKRAARSRESADFGAQLNRRLPDAAGIYMCRGALRPLGTLAAVSYELLSRCCARKRLLVNGHTLKRRATSVAHFSAEVTISKAVPRWR